MANLVSAKLNGIFCCMRV